MTEIIDISDWFNTTVDILTTTKVKDTAGSYTKGTPTLVHSAVPARIRQLTGRERETLGRLGQESTHRIYTPTEVGGSPIVIDNVQKFFIRSGTREFDLFRPDDPHEEGDFLQIDGTLRS